MIQLLDRRAMKERVKTLLERAQVSPKRITALFMGLSLILHITAWLGDRTNPVALFVLVFSFLLSVILEAGFTLYCMRVRRGERAEYRTLFDGFSFTGTLIPLYLIKSLLISFWSMFFILPGVIALYRYRFAPFNLLDSPELGALEALMLSSRQTNGYKMQVFKLDMSYLPWKILGASPFLLYWGGYSLQISARVGDAPDPEEIWKIAETISPDVFGVPVTIWLIGILLCPLLAALFYLPHYRCVLLEYFETAKYTSSLDEDSDAF